MKMFNMIQTWVKPRTKPNKSSFLVTHEDDCVEIRLTPKMFDALMRAAIVGQAELRRIESVSGLSKTEVSRLWYLHREAGIAVGRKPRKLTKRQIENSK